MPREEWLRTELRGHQRRQAAKFAVITGRERELAKELGFTEEQISEAEADGRLAQMLASSEPASARDAA
jgi:hypothetical protein